MGGLISRKARRARSSSGYVIVSHTDANGANRLANLGKYFFGLDDPSDYDNLIKNSAAPVSHQKGLVPWTSDDVYTIPKYTRFPTTNGVEFIATESVQSRPLKERWSDIVSDATKLESFYKAGGWNGIKYVKVPVIQGKRMEIDLGPAKGSKYESFAVMNPNIEDASNAISMAFLKFIITFSTGKTEEWVPVQSVLVAGPYDKVFETKQTPDGSGTIFKVGNGITGKMLPAGANVKVQYLETLGDAGNIDRKYQVTKMVYPDGEAMIDPRTNSATTFLSCTNVVPLLGGYNAEDTEDYRTNAPTSYLREFGIATTAAYIKQIKNYSPVSLLKLRAYPDSTYETSSVSSVGDDDIVNEIGSIRKTLNITAILANGEKIENAEESFIAPVVKSLADLKGPNDSLRYVEPNFIQVRLGLRVKTDDLNITDAEVQTIVRTGIADTYSIFNTDFQKPLRSSKVISVAKMYPFSSSVSLTMEALASTNYDKSAIKLVKTGLGTELVYIPFKFDAVYGYNQYKKGFKNFRVNAPYLLKVNLEFINDAAKASEKNRTFFLIDERNRMNGGSSYTVEAAKAAPDLKLFQKDLVSADSAIGRVVFYEEERENFNSRYIRVAQFPYLSSITDDAFMTKARSFAQEPYEIRPYKVDEKGQNKVLSSDNVPTSLQVAMSSDSTVCYQADNRFIPYTDVIFHENYDSPDSEEFAAGALILPLSYLGFGNQLSGYGAGQELEKLSTLSILLKDFVRVKVFAVPLIEDIETDRPNDIIFVDDADIIVEKEKIFS